MSTVDSIGRMVVAGGAVVGIGALCYYGLGMSNEIGAIEKAVWVSEFCTTALEVSCGVQINMKCIHSFKMLHHHHFWLTSLCRYWPQYVKDRIHSTYMYFAGSVGLTALSAVAVSRTPALMGLMMGGSWMVSFKTQTYHKLYFSSLRHISAT